MLWFDVVFQYYTTVDEQRCGAQRLWFDVVFQYYTTSVNQR